MVCLGIGWNFGGKYYSMAFKKQQQNEYAKILFTERGLTQKEIAERVGVTEKTVGNWVKKGDWEKLKKSLLVTKKNQISKLYDQLEWLTNHIANREAVRDIPDYLLKPRKEKNEKGDFVEVYPEYDPEDYPIKIGNVATSKEADALAKITRSISNLETETSIGHIVEVAQEFIDFVRGVDLKKAKEITALFDMFINEKMK